MLVQSYAHALYDLLFGVSENEAARRIAQFLAVVEKRGHRRLLPAIVRRLEYIQRRERDKSTITVTLAQRGDYEKLEGQISRAKRMLSAEDKPETVALDDTLIGGFRAKGPKGYVDGSYKHTLLELYNRMRAA